MKVEVTYTDGTEKVVNLNLNASQTNVDGMIMAARASQDLYSGKLLSLVDISDAKSDSEA